MIKTLKILVQKDLTVENHLRTQQMCWKKKKNLSILMYIKNM